MSDYKTGLINLSALQSTAVTNKPFPYLVVPNFINTAYLNDLVDSFPPLPNRGSIPAMSVNCADPFRQLINELEGPALRHVIAEKFDINLHDKPTMLTLRGQTTERDGHIHTDSKSKLMTVLLYMNKEWDTPEGKLRLLKNKHSLSDYVEEVSPLAGTCLIFKVTRNGWHGHTPFIGKRLSLQLNYLAGESALTKHLNHHRLTAFLKRRLPRLFHTATEENY